MFSKLGLCPDYVRDGKCSKAGCKLNHGKDVEFEEEKKTHVTKPKSSGKKFTPKVEEAKLVDKVDEFSGYVFADPGRTIRMGELHRKKLEDENKKLMKSQLCKFLFEKGSCKFGDRCFYSHGRAAAPAGRGGRPLTAAPRREYMPPMAPVIVDMEWDAVFDRAAVAERVRPPPMRSTKTSKKHSSPVKKPETKPEDLDKYEQDKDESSSEEEVVENLDLFEQRLRKVHKDLDRLEPVRKALFRGKSLDVMFIIDCTGSMGSWINASKKEIKSIIECIRNQYYGI